jgi:CheY-like chemotaxis protein
MPARAGRAIVLVVEPDPVAGERLAAVLEGGGYAVLRLTTGRELLGTVYRTLYQQGEPRRIDLIVAAAAMPELSGVAIVRLLRDADLAVPAILLATDHEKGDVATAVRGGAVVLDRAIDARDLLDAARSCIERILY